MYLSDVTQEQITKTATSGTIRITWKVGSQIPDLVQVINAGNGVTPATVLATIPVDRGTRTPLSCEIVVPAPTFLNLAVSPRLVQQGAMTDQMADEAGQSRYWETFSINLPPFTVAASAPPQEDPVTVWPPRITGRIQPVMATLNSPTIQRRLPLVSSTLAFYGGGR